MQSIVSDEEAARRAARDLEAMVDASRAAGVPVILIDYPWMNAAWVNRAIHAAGEARGVPVVSSAGVFQRMARTHDVELLIERGAGPHPPPRLYGQVVEELLPTLPSLLAETHGLTASGSVGNAGSPRRAPRR